MAESIFTKTCYSSLNVLCWGLYFYHLFCDLTVWSIYLTKGVKLWYWTYKKNILLCPNVPSNKAKQPKGICISYSDQDVLIMLWWSVNSSDFRYCSHFWECMSAYHCLPKVLNVLYVLSPFSCLISPKWSLSLTKFLHWVMLQCCSILVLSLNSRWPVGHICSVRMFMCVSCFYSPV